MKKVFLFLILLIFPFTIIEAKETKKASKTNETKIEDKFIIECDAGKYYVGDQVICRTTINSSYSYNKMSFKLETDSGLKVVDVRSNYEQRWSINIKDNIVTSKTKEQLQNGLQEFGIILIDALQSGELPIKVKNIVLENTKTKDTLKLADTETKLKIISSDNELKEILIDGIGIDDFTPDKTTYNIDVKAEDKIKIEAFTKNEFATLDGVGEFEIDKKNSKTIIPIEVVSESGNSKIYTIIINNTDFKDDGIDKTIDSILLKNSKGDVILYNYTPDVFEYYIDVDSELDEINISPTTENKDLSIVKKYGSRTIDLKYGNNIVLVKSRDSKDQEVTYILNITRPLKNKSSNKYLKLLEIKGYNLEFSKKIKNYRLPIKKGTDSLKIIAEPEDAKSVVTITGNNNLKKGSVIRITVTAENESKFVYNLNIEETISESHSLSILFAILIVFVILLIIHKRKENREKKKITIKKQQTILETEIIKNNKETVNVEEKEEPKELVKEENTTTEKTTRKKNSAKKPTTKKSTGTKTAGKKNISKKPTTKKPNNPPKKNGSNKSNQNKKNSNNKNTQNKKTTNMGKNTQNKKQSNVKKK